MKTEEANRLKDKQNSVSSVSVKANLVESSGAAKDRFINKGKKFQKGGYQKKFKGNNGKIQKDKLHCYCCGKPGHKAYQCYQRKNQKPDSNPDGKPAPQINVAETDEIIAAVVVEANLLENRVDWLTRKHGSGLYSNRVCLKVLSGDVWEVELQKENGDIWLHNGWQQFIGF